MGTATATATVSAERNQALMQHYPMVSRIAHRVAATYGLPVGVEANDLVSCGVIGLAEAWERFDPSRGVAFEAFAVPRVRGSIIDAIRASDWVPRKARQRSRRTGEPVAMLVSLDGGRSDGEYDGSGAERITDDTIPLPGAEMLSAEQRHELIATLNRLPEREKMIVTLHYFHGVQLAQIARNLGVTESRVSQLHGRALRMLREGLEAADQPAVA
jgi:RNA polymerase sigma factor for flagellar operon FliA